MDIFGVGVGVDIVAYHKYRGHFHTKYDNFMCQDSFTCGNKT